MRTQLHDVYLGGEGFTELLDNTAVLLLRQYGAADPKVAYDRLWSQGKGVQLRVAAAKALAGFPDEVTLGILQVASIAHHVGFQDGDVTSLGELLDITRPAEVASPPTPDPTGMVCGETTAMDADLRSAPMATPEQEATRRELMMGTTPAPTPYRPGMGCGETTALLREIRNVPMAKPPLTPSKVGVTIPEPTWDDPPEPPPPPPPSAPPTPLRSQRNQPSSWAQPLALLGCIVAAYICRDDRETCTFYLVIGIPGVLIYFWGQREAEEERRRR